MCEVVAQSNMLRRPWQSVGCTQVVKGLMSDRNVIVRLVLLHIVGFYIHNK